MHNFIKKMTLLCLRKFNSDATDYVQSTQPTQTTQTNLYTICYRKIRRHISFFITPIILSSLIACGGGGGGGGNTATEVPTAPASAAATPLGFTSLRVTWDSVPQAERYEVYDSNGVKVATIVPPATSYTATGLSPNTEYTYSIKACNESSCSTSAASSAATSGNKNGGDTIINSAAELNAIRADSSTLAGNYILAANIDLSDIPNWRPIGDSANGFTGSFDGSGYEISGMTISGYEYAGLFGYVHGASISNLGVNVNNINSSSTHAYAGGLAAHANSSFISNVYVIVASDITSSAKSSSYAGGLFGRVDNSQISNSYVVVRGSVYSSVSEPSASSYAGGLVGYADSSSISNSYYSASRVTLQGDFTDTTGTSGVAKTVAQLEELTAESTDWDKDTWYFGTANDLPKLSSDFVPDVEPPPVNVPASPRGVTLEPLSSTSIRVSWNSVSDVEFYKVYNNRGGSVNTTPPATSYTATDLLPNTGYTYRVAACNDSGCSAFTSRSAATLPVPIPATPSNVAAAVQGLTSIRISWDSVDGATSYEVYNGDVQVATIDDPATSYTATALSPNTEYTYSVKACNNSGCSDSASASTTRTPVAIPDSPSSISAAGQDFTSVTITWSKVSGAKRYEVYKGDEKVATLDESRTTYIINKGLLPATEYTYSVKACNDSGCSDSTELDFFTPSIDISSAPQVIVVDSTIGQANPSLRVSWNDIRGVTSYQIFDAAENKVATVQSPTTSHIIADLSAGTLYEYKVRGCYTPSVTAPGAPESSEICGDFSAVGSATTPVAIPAVPSNVAAAVQGLTSIRISWDSVVGAEYYEVHNGDVQVATIDDPATRYTATDLLPATEYIYSVKACNTSGCSVAASAAPTPTPVAIPAVPSNVAAAVQGLTSIRISWDSVVRARSYEVYNGDELVTTIDDPATSYTATDLLPNTEYTYSVKACNISGCSDSASAATTITPVAIPDSSSSISTGSLNLTARSITWDKVSGATFYQVNNSEGQVTTINHPATTSYNATALLPNTEYTYSVKACNISGCSVSTEITFTTEPIGVSSTLEVTVVTSTIGQANPSLMVSWDGIMGVTSYQIFDAAGNADENKVATVPAPKTSHIIAGLTAGTLYEYRVRGCYTPSAPGSSEVCGDFSAVDSATTPVAIPDSSSSISTGSLNLTARSITWDKVSGATFYQVNNSEGQVTTINHPATTSYTATGLLPNTEYTYSVKACNISGCSVSTEVTFTTEPIGVSSALEVTVVTSTIGQANPSLMLSWGGIMGVTSYQIFDAAGNADENKVATVPAPKTSHIIAGLSAGTLYEYRVRGCYTPSAPASPPGSSEVCGDFSAVDSATTPVAIPDSPSSISAAGQDFASISIAWRAVLGATSYEVYNGDVQVATIDDPATRYTATALLPNTEYTYSVKACNTSGCSVSTGVTFTTEPIGVSSTLEVTVVTSTIGQANPSLMVSWSRIAGVTSYQIFDAAGNADENKVATVQSPATTHIIADLSAGTLYEYKVRGCYTPSAPGSTEVCGDFSAVGSATTPVAIPDSSGGVTIGSLGFTSITITWGEVSGATSYEVYKGDAKVDTIDASTTSYTATDLSPNTEYTYSVKACNTSGCSVVGEITATTKAIGASSAPRITAVASTIGQAAPSLNVSWDHISGVTSYQIFDAAENADGNKVATVPAPKTSHIIADLLAGAIYTYKVRGCYASSAESAEVCGDFSPAGSATAPVAIPDSPSIISAGSLSLTARSIIWGAVSGAASYEVYKGNEKASTINAPTTSYTATALLPNIGYTYSVKACNTSGCSDPTEVSFTTDPIDVSSAPRVTVVDSTIGKSAPSLNVSWDRISGVTSYQIFDADENADENAAENKVATVPTPNRSHIITNLSAGTLYEYKVRGCYTPSAPASPAGSTEICGEFSPVGSATTPVAIPDAPGNVAAASLGFTSIRISWDSVEGTAFYEVNNSDGLVIVINHPATSYTATDLLPNTEYTYRVKTCNPSVCSSTASATAITNGNKAGGTTSISSAAELAAIHANDATLAGNYALTGNIDLSSIANWQPIGNGTNKFTGSFDGNGYNISGVSSSGYKHAGLFGFVQNANISNIGVLVGNISSSSSSYSDSYSGGLVGRADNSQISNSYAVVEGSISSSSSYSDSYSGGLVGAAFNNSPISNSYAVVEGDISSSSREISSSGGLVGAAFNNSPISNSYAVVEGSISSSSSRDISFSGGLVGYAEDSRISNSYAVVEGGIFSSSSSSSGSSYSGGLVGYANANSPISDSYYSASRKSLEGGFSNTVGISRTPAQLRALTASVTTWDGGIWDFGTDANLPKLRSLPFPVATSSLASPEDVTATALSLSSISMSWSSVVGATSYEVYNSEGLVGSTSHPATNYTATGLLPNTQYTYRVRACNLFSCSDFASDVSATTDSIGVSIVPQVTLVASTIGRAITSLKVSWDSIAGVTSYQIVNRAGEEVATVSPQSTEYVVAGLSAGTLYEYQVRGCYDSGVSASPPGSSEICGELSPVGSATTSRFIPSAPSRVTATVLGITSLSISWNSVEGATSYQVHNSDGVVTTIEDPATSYTTRDLLPNTRHTYRVKACNGSSCSASVSASATTNDGVLINSAAKLAAIRSNSNTLARHYALTRNIDLSSMPNWRPIGDFTNKFTGSFDGNGYNISGVSSSGYQHAGLFGYVENANIRNIGVLVGDISSSLYSSYTGGLVGYAYRSSISNSYAVAEGSISSPSSYTGGLVGYAGSSSISNSYAVVKGSISSHNNLGALVGGASDSSISNSYAVVEGSISSSSSNIFGSYSGGLVGYAGSSPISNSYAVVKGSISSSNLFASYSGGLAGYAYSSRTSNSYAVVKGSISSSSSSPTVTAAYSGSGGLFGGADNSPISNSYALVASSISISSSSDSYSYSGGLVGIAGSSPISNSYAVVEGSISSSASGSSSSSSYSGGLVGNAGSSPISNSYALVASSISISSYSSSFYSSSYSGGLVGLASTSVGPLISNSYAVVEGSISSSSSNTGGLVGGVEDRRIFRFSEIISKSYYSASHKYSEGRFSNTYGTSQTLTQLRHLTASATGWSAGIWDFGTDANLPILRSLPSPAVILPLASPGDFTAKALGLTSISISWDRVGRATSYEVHNSEGLITTINRPTTTSYAITGLLPDTEYTYRVRACNLFDCSDFVSASAVTMVVRISSALELAAIRSNRAALAGDYALTGNIDLSHILNWEPIGNSINAFTGSFDGNGYNIGGIRSRGYQYAGLFGYVENANISNVGVLAGSISSPLSDFSNSGGLVGYASSSQISNSYAVVEGSISSSSSSSDFSASGGLVGYARSSEISKSYAVVEGSISSSYFSGGLVGRVHESPISNSYALVGGSILSSDYSGGLVGHAHASPISNSYALVEDGISSSESDYSGGLVGRAINSQISKSYYSASHKSSEEGFDNTHGTSQTVAQLRALTAEVTFWDTGIWDFGTDANLPTLRSLPSPAATRSPANLGDVTAAALGLTSISISWGSVVGATSYEVYNSGALVTTIDAPATSHTFTDLLPDTQYTYRVRACNLFSCSAFASASAMTTRATSISSAAELAAIRTDSTSLAGDYALTGNIDLSHIPNWQPIGDFTNRFTGSFDGNGYKISGVSSTGYQFAGLFGYVSSASISNVGVLIGSISATSPNGFSNSGGLVGRADYSVISNTYVVVEGSISSTYFSGGLVGRADSSEISNSYAVVEGGISSSSVYESSSGGLVGWAVAGGTISNSYAVVRGGISSSSPSSGSPSFSGGLVGRAGSSIINSYAVVEGGISSSTSGNSYSGGLVGLGAENAISKSYYSASRKSSEGGFDNTLGTLQTLAQLRRLTATTTGWNAGIWDFGTAANLPTLRSLPSPAPAIPGDVTATALGLTAISISWGSVDRATSYEVYNSGALVTTIQPPASSYTATGLSPDTKYTYRVRACNVFGCSAFASTSAMTMVIRISGAADLAAIRTNRNTLAGDYALTGNIDLSDISNWQPIGDFTNRFTGSFDGNGYNISGVSSTGYRFAGLFGYVENADISNVGVLVGNISSSSSNSYSGGLVGYASNSPISNSYAIVTGDISSSSSSHFSYSGGLVGRAYESPISNSYAVVGGSISSSSSTLSSSSSYSTYSGGLVGSASNSPISNSSALVEGSISSSAYGFNTYSGGLIGRASRSPISNSYATIMGDISSSSYAYSTYSGGLIGYADESQISNSYAVVTGNISSSSSSSDYSYSSSAGGLVGRAREESSIINSYAVVEGSISSSSSPGASYSGGLVGRASNSPISNSYAVVEGSISSSAYSGGLVGSASNSPISNSYAVVGGSISSSSSSSSLSGGLVGLASNSQISNSYAVVEGGISANYNSGGLVGTAFSSPISDSYYSASRKLSEGEFSNTHGTSQTVAQLRVLTAEVTTWDGGIWDFGTDANLPKLRSLSFPVATSSLASPEGVTATALSLSSISMSWSSVVGATSYEVYNSEGLVGSTSHPATSYTATGLLPDTQYTYRVRACNLFSCSDFASDVSATTDATVGKTSAPQVTVVASTIGRIMPSLKVSWDSIAGVTSYQIFDATGNNKVATVSTPSTEYVVAGLAAGTLYEYQVRGCYDSGVSASPPESSEICGELSPVGSATTSRFIPSAPSGVTATALGITSLSISWNSVEGALTYQVHNSGVLVATIDAPTTSYTTRDLLPNKRYTYSVKACYNSDCSDSVSASATTENGITISSATDLAAIRTDSNTLDGDYALTGNIDLSDISNWQPIGDKANKFTGSFDGNGYKISGVSSSGYRFAGLFGWVEGASISNVGVLVGSISSSSPNGFSNSGGLVGRAVSSEISNSYVVVEGSISSIYISGGLVGRADSSEISNSYTVVEGSISSSSSSLSSYSGGLIGYANNSQISNSYALVEGSISSTSSSELSSSGGLVGYAQYGRISNSYAVVGGSISSSSPNSYSGGLVGRIFNGQISKSYYSVIRKPSEGGSLGTSQTLTQLRALTAASTTWDAGIWDFGTAANLPTLRSLPSPAPAIPGDVTATALGLTSISISWGSVDKATSYEIHNSERFVASTSHPTTSYTATRLLPDTKYTYRVRACNVFGCSDFASASATTMVIRISSTAEFAAIHTNSNTLAGDYALTGNIDLSDISNWQPIGNFTNKFTGSFDGNGYNISGVSSSGYQYAGLFGYVRNANISNVGVLVGNISSSSSSSSSSSGGLVGYAVRSPISNSYAIATGDISSSSSSFSYAGGLVGYADNSPISNSYAVVGGNISSSSSSSSSSSFSYAGGLVGNAGRSPISNSYAVVGGSISSSSSSSSSSTYSSSGGLVGLVSSSDISNSYAVVEGSISSSSGNSYSGGLVGYAYNSLISNSYAVVEGSILSSSSSYSGGLVGFADDDSPISNSYYSASHQSSEGGFSNTNGTSQTVAQLRRLTAASTTWDGGIWDFGTDANLPKLRSLPSSDITAILSLASPEDVTAIALSLSSISMSWSNVVGATSYEVYNSEGLVGSTSHPATNYAATGLLPATQYTYRVRACNLFSCSAFASASAMTMVASISSAAELAAIRSNSASLAGDYALTGNIDLSHIPNWQPIGDYANQFTGTFDGNGYNISGVSSSGYQYAGLFGYVENADISNVGVLVGNISSSARDISYSGGLIGYASRSSISNSYALVEGSISSLLSSTSSSFLLSASSGGLVGIADNSPVSNSYAVVEGSISSSTSFSFSSSSSGGLVGSAYSSPISNSYAVVETSISSLSTSSFASSSSGGLVGWVSSSEISNSYAVVVNDISSITYSGSNSFSGGLVAFIEGNSPISKSYYSASHQSSEGTFTNTHGTSQTLAELRRLTADATGWDEVVWDFGTDANLPKLRFLSFPIATSSLVSPEDVTATALSLNSISMSWGSVVGATSYEVYNGEGLVGSTSHPTTSYTATGLLPDTQYTYRVRACNLFSCSDFASDVSATTDATIGTSSSPQVTLVASTIGRAITSLKVSWDSIAGVTSYQIFDATGNNKVATVPTPSTEYVVAGLSAGTLYEYKVRGCYDSGVSASPPGSSEICGELSPVGSATTSRFIPSAPSGVTATVLGITSLSISWNSVEEALTYQVHNSGGLVATIEAPTTSYTARGLLPNTGYTYSVKACNDTGCSASVSASATTENGITISSAADLAAIHTNSSTLAGDYALTGNIDLSDIPNWQPIGDKANKFTGSFDGNGYNISGVSSSGYQYAGLFGYVENANISNVGVLVGNISSSSSSDSYSGGLVGYADYSEISNSYAVVEGGISSDYNSGGLVGYAEGSQISNSYAVVEGSISSSSPSSFSVAGGLVGWTSRSPISNSYAVVAGSISSSSSGNSYSGGLVGLAYNGSPISNSYAVVAGSISSSSSSSYSSTSYSYSGGLVGYADYSEISNSYAVVEGSISSSSSSPLSSSGSNSGGLVGFADSDSPISNSYAVVAGSISSSSSSPLSSSDSYSGGLVGLASYSPISNSYAVVGGSISSSSSGDSYSGGLVGGADDDSDISKSYYRASRKSSEGIFSNTYGTSQTLAELRRLTADATTWDAGIWDFGTNNDLPILRSLPSSDITATLSPASPEYFTATALGLTSISMSWGNVDKATSYEVYNSSGLVTTIDAPTTNYGAIGLLPNTQYTYRVRACNVFGCSDFASASAMTMVVIIKISSAADLAAIRTNDATLAGNYTLTGNIDLSDIPNWQPIGDYANEFTGTFDGNGYNISGVSSSGYKYAGLFGYVVGANISNVGVLVGNISSSSFSSYLGGLVGRVANSQISNSYAVVGGSISSPSAYSGGLVGDAYNSPISNSYAVVEGSISLSSSFYSGGLVGSADNSPISDSYAVVEGNISSSASSSNSYLGGLAGYADKSPISNSYAVVEGNISSSSLYSSSFTGGLVGRTFNQSPISNSYALVEGSISSDSSSGGLVGWARFSDISNSYALVEGSISSSSSGSSYSGGLVGYATSSPISDSYYSASRKSSEGAFSNALGTSQTVAELRALTADATGWDEVVWDFGTNNDLPTLRSSHSAGIVSPLPLLPDPDTDPAPDPDSNNGVGKETNRDTDGDGTPDHVDTDDDDDNYSDALDVDDDGDGLIEIATAEQLNQVRHNLLGSSLKASAVDAGDTTGCGGLNGITECNGYELVADISLAGYNSDNWLPIGSCPTFTEAHVCTDVSALFNAVFDGNGYTISNLTITNSIESYTNATGLFGAISPASQLRNIHIRSANLIGGANNVGVLVGYAARASIIDSSAVGEITAYGANVGGLVGFGRNTTIISSYAAGGNIVGVSTVGGLIGSGERATISSSYAAGGDVGGVVYIGGLVGSGNSVTISLSYAAGGHVAGALGGAGGLVGSGENARVISSYAAGGNVSGFASIGGLIGSGENATIISSYAAGGAVLTGFGVGDGLVGSEGVTATDSYWDSDTTGVEAGIYGLPQTTSELQSPTSATGIYTNWATDECDDGGDAWDFGTASQYPVLTCTPNGVEAQRP